MSWCLHVPVRESRMAAVLPPPSEGPVLQPLAKTEGTDGEIAPLLISDRPSPVFLPEGSRRLPPRLAMLKSPRHRWIGPRGSYHGLQDGVRMADTDHLRGNPAKAVFLR